MNYMNASRDTEMFVRRDSMMERLTVVEEFSEEGAIWKIGDNEYIVQKNRCGEDDLYWTDSLEEAYKEFVSEEEEELVNLTLHDEDKLVDLMTEYETLSMPRLKQLMAEQGFYLDKSDLTIKRKEE